MIYFRGQKLALTVYPDREAQKVEIAFTLDRVPADVGVALPEELRIRGDSTTGQVGGDHLELLFAQRQRQFVVVPKGGVGHIEGTGSP